MDRPEPAIPDSSRPGPKALKKSALRSALEGVAIGTGGLAAVAGAFFIVVAGSATRCRGSTRSYRLTWERRQQEIADVISREQGDRAANESAGAIAADASRSSNE
jgi:hypothetical protein